MENVIQSIANSFKKSAVVDVRTGDTVKVHQRIREGSKERVQIFQGLVIRTSRRGSQTSSIIVRRVASGIGVEKSFLLHSPLILKVEITKRSKVRRNYLTYMRGLTGKAARMTSLAFDSKAVNSVHDVNAEAEEEKLKEESAKAAQAVHDAEAAKQAKLDAKADEVAARHAQN